MKVSWNNQIKKSEKIGTRYGTWYQIKEGSVINEYNEQLNWNNNSKLQGEFAIIVIEYDMSIISIIQASQLGDNG